MQKTHDTATCLDRANMIALRDEKDPPHPQRLKRVQTKGDKGRASQRKYREMLKSSSFIPSHFFLCFSLTGLLGRCSPQSRGQMVEM